MFAGASLLDERPGVVGIESGCGFGDVGGFWAKVGLVNVAVLIDHEGHHTGNAIFGRVSDEGEAAGHVVFNEIVLLASQSVRALSAKNAEEVAVKGCRSLGGSFFVPFGTGACRYRPERAFRFTFGGLPIEAVVLSFATDKFARVLLHFGAELRLGEVFGLCVGHSVQDIDDSEFVVANLAR